VAAQDVEQVFKVMGEMLKSPHQTSQTQSQSQTNTHWTGLVSHHQNIQPNINITMNITLARTDDGSPKFFNCTLSAKQ